MSMVRGSAHYEGLLPIEPSDEPPPLRPTILEDPFPNGQPSLRKRASRALSRFLAIFCVGVGTTLAWQSYGDAAREMIANSYPQLGWLAPPAAVAQTGPDTIVPTTSSPDPQEIKAISVDLAALRQRVDQLAAQLAASQQQMARDFATKLQAAAQDILDKISAPPLQPAAAPVRKPASPPLQLAPAR